MYCDQRVAGVEKWYAFTPPDAGMRVPNEIRDCTCFLCVKLPDGTYKANGTAFFLSFPSREEPSISWRYLVTAKHCVYPPGGGLRKLYARINTRDGDAKYVDLPNTADDWRCPSDLGSDVTILEFTPTEQFQFGTIDFQSSTTSQNLKDHNIGIGNETLTIGLFTMREGTKRNIPILRSGMISAIPDEPIHDSKTGRIYSAYLIEMLSIGGLSGSPVFAHVPSAQLNTKDQRERFPGGYLFLLGVISSHFEEEPDIDFIEKSKRDRINAGIATVTPISEVIDTVTNDDKLYQRRRAKIKQHREENSTTFDSASESDEPNENFTQADFEAALKKVARKIEPEKST
jgi:hypothetical protein